jgi:hypothetical protein
LTQHESPHILWNANEFKKTDSLEQFVHLPRARLTRFFTAFSRVSDIHTLYIKENLMNKRLSVSGSLFLCGVLALLLTSATIPNTRAQKGAKQSLGHVSTTELNRAGSSKLGTKVVISGAAIGNETRSGPEQDQRFDKQITGSLDPARVPSAQVPRPESNRVVGSDSSGFNGLTHRDQRLASGGNQFNIEPPDQGLAVGNGFVLEAVNTALAAHDTSGALVGGPIALNEFYNLAPAIVRNNPADPNDDVFGPFLTDPRCYYDSNTQRWFVTAVEIDVNPATGAFLGHSEIEIAVSKTADPTGEYFLYTLNVTNNLLPDAETPFHRGCPCFGDQPLIGADQYGFYITTNEFPIFVAGFNGAQVYAMSKASLVAGTFQPTAVVSFAGLPLAEGVSYTLQPATTPPGGVYETINGGTEYFMSALQFGGIAAITNVDNRIAVWALTNTSSLDSATPTLTLTNAVITSEVYAQPPAAEQPPGPTPLRDILASGALGVVLKEKLELIESNDDRMQQAVFAGGHLWSALSTAVRTGNGPIRVGIAYFIVTPSWNGSKLDATIARQGYVAVNRNNLLFPAIGVNAAGLAAMTFTLVGPDYYPSAAYVRLAVATDDGDVHIAAPGAGPEDGFTGYRAFGGNGVARWGDYSAAVADENGAIWIATEYIPPLPRTVLANWGTFIAQVNP